MLTKKIQKTDYIFILVLFAGILFHLVSIFVPNISADESFYVTIPFRLINGDFLVQHEWHLSQFSSLFLYLPVYLWIKIKGSANGIILFLRFLYLLIHTTAASAVYIFFRKYKGWAIAATMMFYMHIPYSLYAVSYTSMLVIFLLLFTFCLLSIYNKPSAKLYILAGFFYGGCCVCNPALCLIFFAYILACALWIKRNIFSHIIVELKEKIRKRIHHKHNQKHSEKKVGKSNDITNTEKYCCFFSGKAIAYFFIGICIVAIISIVYFFGTGGTLLSIAENLHNLFSSSEHIIESSPFAEKFGELRQAINNISFNMPFLLPALFLALFFDKNRRNPSNRFIYLLLSFLLGILYAFGILKMANFKTACFALPFAVFSVVCYILTENKNKPLFYLMWCPCITAAIICFFTQNTVLFIVGAVFSVSNIAGLFFLHDLYKEINTVSNNKKTKVMRNKKIISATKILFCIAYLFQILTYMTALQYFLITNKDDIDRVTDGPYSRTIMSSEENRRYEDYLNDFDLIKNRSDENEPVLFSTFNNWSYLYVDRPVATYTTWFRGEFNKESLLAYYEENPEKIPRYIYIDAYNLRKEYSVEFMKQNINIAGELFEFTQEELSNGMLLTVTDCKFYTD